MRIVTTIVGDININLARDIGKDWTDALNPLRSSPSSNSGSSDVSTDASGRYEPTQQRRRVNKVVAVNRQQITTRRGGGMQMRHHGHIHVRKVTRW